jgi:hypothetical protein
VAQQQSKKPTIITAVLMPLRNRIVLQTQPKKNYYNTGDAKRHRKRELCCESSQKPNIKTAVKTPTE